MEQIQMELSQVKALPACNICKQIICGHKKPEWNLTISNGTKGIQVQTSVKTLSDLEKFLKEGLAFFCSPEKITPFVKTGGARMLVVTYPITEIEAFFKTAIQTSGKKQRQAGSLVLFQPSDILMNQKFQLFKRNMLQNYFSCIGILVPILPVNIYYPKLCNDLDSLLTYAIVSLVAYTLCEHAGLKGFPFTRIQLADHCRTIAQKKLEEFLFEQDPTPELCCALLFISTGCLLRLSSDEARAYSNICWHMIIKMKPCQDPVQEQIRIRAFYLCRYLEYNFLKTADSIRSFTSTSFHISTIPTHLDCELDNKMLYDSICCFQFVVRLMSCSAYNPEENEETFFGFFSGKLNYISSSTIHCHEHILLQVRKTLPIELQIGNGPFEYTNEVLCTSSFVLRVNAMYYIYWLIINCKIMQSPTDTDSPNPHYFHIDSSRSLMITSICIDVLTKLYAALTIVAPCSVDTYWLSTCFDIALLLSSSKNKQMHDKAIEDMLILANIFKKKTGFDLNLKDDRISKECLIHDRCGSMTSDSDGTSSYCDSPKTENNESKVHTPLIHNLKESLRKYIIDDTIS